MGLGAVAAATVAGTAISAGTSLMGANKAAQGAKNAATIEGQMYDRTRGDLMPFIQSGQGALPQLNALTYGDPAAVQAQLEQTPGYQFTLGQGLKATQASAAARGLGVSGAALKGAATYATGLADATFEQRFNDALKTASLGESAAAGLGTIGTTSAANQGTALMNKGNLLGQGIQGVGNALNSGINNYLGYNAYQNALSTGGYDTGGVSKASTADTGWQPAPS